MPLHKTYIAVSAKKIIYTLAAILICTIALKAQSSATIYQSLQKLNTVGSVLYVAAHPDDENTRLLGYLSNERKLRTAYLSLTRGDGGQNLIGKEQGEALGLIRTQELLAARKTDGAEQYFTRANDFGFSKNPEETFGFWNKDSILADVVWTIRQFKPDVIICRFPTTGEGGHGHHTASAILAVEAFDAAADPKRFPEQLQYVTVWQAKRIFWNTFNFGGTNTTSSDQLKIDVGGYNKLLGKSYGEVAAESRSMHKSQGFGSARQRGSNLEYFKLLKGENAAADLFEGINQTWSRFANTSAIQSLINTCIVTYNLQAPELIVADLVKLHHTLEVWPSASADISYWKKQKLIELESLIIACSGIWLEASTNEYSTTLNSDIVITAQMIARNNIEVQLESISFPAADTITNLQLKQDEFYSFKHTSHLTITEPTNPYWLKSKHGIGLYNVPLLTLRGTPENVSNTLVSFNISIAGLKLKLDRPLIYKSTDPVKGEVYRPFEILPPATINLSEKSVVFTDDKPKALQLTIKANKANITGTVKLTVTAGWNVSIVNPDFTLTDKGAETIIEATITPGKNAQDGSIAAVAVIDGQEYTKAIKRIDYDHIPSQFILSDAEARLVNVDLKKGGLNIGYIPGAGDDVAATLKQAGYTVTILTDELLANEQLLKYNAIVSGVRAYNTNERLQVHYNKLMEYVKNGGNLIVQYNTNNRIGPLVAKIGPYPFTISRDRVTDETAHVKFINEKHIALNIPNKISAKDFERWVQERGIYFATEADKNYETILSMNDPNEKPGDGSLIIAKYGKGNFVYTGLVFFRELPAGVPGAYRLFANLLALPTNK
jgi:LmbE family N-acetylglucosaminyl deacetylase